MYTLHGKIRSTCHTPSTLNLHRVPDPTSHVVHVGNLLLVPTRMKYAPTPGRRATEDRLVRPSSWVTSFSLSHDSLRVGERGFSKLVTQLHQLAGHISPTYDRYVRYLLTGTNPSVLNRHRRELSHRNLRITTTLSLPFPSECSTGPPNWPLRLSILSDIKHRLQGSSLKEHMAVPWSSNHSVVYRNLHLCLAIANDLSLAI
jgi:hypothetical protein